MTVEKQLCLFDEAVEGRSRETTREMLDQLLTDSKLYRSSDAFKALMDFAVRMRNMAPFNAMLLNLQKPGLTYAASAYDWMDRFNRAIKEDARPLLIMWPFGPVATVYDVLDTHDVDDPHADGLPENIATFFSTGDITEARIENFGKLLAAKNIELDWVDHGDANAGEIQRKGDLDFPDENRYVIKINQNHTLPTQFTTLAHELAHLFLGHLGAHRNMEVPQRRHLTVGEQEIEAECTAFLVCNRNGVTAKSESYLSSFVDNGIEPDQLDIYQIMRAAGQIETVLDLTLHTKFKEPDANQLKLPF